jgi:hypothetical protein
MDVNFILEADLVKREYLERLQEAERERRYRQILNNQPKRQFQPLVIFGEFLITVGQKLNGKSRSGSAASA